MRTAGDDGVQVSRFVLLGNPGSPRLAHFAHALVAAGRPAPRIVAWLDLLREGRALLERLPDEPLLWRIDSAGQDVQVERALLRRGYEATRALGRPTTLDPDAVEALAFEPGRILAPRQAHEGFVAALGDLARVAALRPSWRLLTPAWAIREMFDKRAASRRLADEGVPVARALPTRETAHELRSCLKDEQVGAAWIKLTCGSSASCLALWQLAGPTETLITTMERTPRGLYNSKRVRRYARRDDVDRLVDFLLGEGAHVEENVPRATLRDRWIDCRVVVVAGEREFVVVRSSRVPMTNLHLGGDRSDVSSLAPHCPPDVLAAALESCRRVRHVYQALHVGVDVAFTRGFESHVVLEANAFGDFVHGLTLGDGGVYAAEIRAASRGP
jgi:hypothetical protein